MSTSAVTDSEIESHMGLVHFAVRGMCYRPDRRAEMVQAGTIGLWKALERHKPGGAGAASFANFALRYIRGYILNDLRATRGKPNTVPLGQAEVESLEAPRPGEENGGCGGGAGPGQGRGRGRLPYAGRSCHTPGLGLGRLSFAEVQSLHTPGATTADIAKRCGVDTSTLSRWRKTNGFIGHWVLRGEPVAKRKLGRLSFDQALALHTPGVETQAVADAAGLHVASVSRWRYDVGLVPTWIQIANA